MVDTVFIAILAIVVLIFSILVGLILNVRFIGGGQDSDHFVDQSLNPIVKTSLIRYTDLSLANIFKTKSQKKQFRTVFQKCISQTINRKYNLTKLRKLLRESSLGKSNAGRDDEWRIKKRIKQLKSLVDGSNLSPPYLDIGCGDGSITEGIATSDLFGAVIDGPENKIKSTKLPVCLEHGDVNPGFNENVIRKTDITKLESDHFGFVTAFMSFHHITNIESMVKEIARVTKPGGTLVIREHNFPYCASGFKKDSDARQYLDWIHIIYDLAEHIDVDDLYSASYERSNYQPEKYWDKLLKANGFEKIKSSNQKNWMCSYFAVYRAR